jgi:hypothetical protein
VLIIIYFIRVWEKKIIPGHPVHALEIEKERKIGDDKNLVQNIVVKVSNIAQRYFDMLL